MASIEADIGEADQTLKKVLEMLEVEDVDDFTVSQLLSAAVISYFRGFSKSNSRDGLADELLGDEWRHTHDMARAYRNRSIAHDDSDVRQTFVLSWVDFSEDAVEIRRPLIARKVLAPPSDFLEDFERLCDHVLLLVTQSVDALSAAVHEELSTLPRDQLWDEARDATLNERSFLEWDPAGKRRGHSYISIEIPPMGTPPHP
jgi:hypothetical protein